MKQADEYRRTADVCLSWAQHAPADDVCLACVTLAMARLKAAATKTTRIMIVHLRQRGYSQLRPGWWLFNDVRSSGLDLTTLFHFLCWELLREGLGRHWRDGAIVSDVLGEPAPLRVATRHSNGTRDPRRTILR